MLLTLRQVTQRQITHCATDLPPSARLRSVETVSVVISHGRGTAPQARATGAPRTDPRRRAANIDPFSAERHASAISSGLLPARTWGSRPKALLWARPIEPIPDMSMPILVLPCPATADLLRNSSKEYGNSPLDRVASQRCFVELDPDAGFRWDAHLALDHRQGLLHQLNAQIGRPHRVVMLRPLDRQEIRNHGR